MSLKIREAQIPIIDDMECMANVTEALTNPFILPSSSFCAGGRGQQDACQVSPSRLVLPVALVQR